MNAQNVPAPYRHQAKDTQRLIDLYRVNHAKTPKGVLWCLQDLLHLVEREHYVMAKQSHESTFGDFRFCSVVLTAEDKIDYEVWAEKHGKDLLSVLAQCVAEGWKTSITWDNDNECFIGSLTCRAEGHKNENVVVSSRSDDMLEAIAISLYKITALYVGKKLPTEKLKNNWG